MLVARGTSVRTDDLRASAREVRPFKQESRAVKVEGVRRRRRRRRKWRREKRARIDRERLKVGTSTIELFPCLVSHPVRFEIEICF